MTTTTTTKTEIALNKFGTPRGFRRVANFVDDVFVWEADRMVSLAATEDGWVVYDSRRKEVLGVGMTKAQAAIDSGYFQAVD